MSPRVFYLDLFLLGEFFTDSIPWGSSPFFKKEHLGVSNHRKSKSRFGLVEIQSWQLLEFSNIPLEHTSDPEPTVYGSEFLSFEGGEAWGMRNRGMLGFS